MIISTFLFTGCEEQFDFIEDRASTNQIIISGFINQSNGPYFAEVRQTAFLGAVPTAVLNACITLVDEGGNREEFEDNLNGTYTCPGNVVRGFPGRSYFIEVELMDGRQYRSRPDRMPMTRGRDRLHWRQIREVETSELGIDIDFNAIQVGLTTNIAGNSQPTYLLWNAEETYEFKPTDFPEFANLTPPPCYIIQDIGNGQINLFTDVGYLPDTFRMEELFVRRLDKSFATKHIFSLYQLSLSEENYEYMKSIEALAENIGSLFDTPPGQALGNVDPITNPEESVQGYFQAVQMDTTRIAIFPTQLQNVVFPFSDNCLYQEGFEDPELYPSQCIDCLILPRSQRERPDYWIFVN